MIAFLKNNKNAILVSIASTLLFIYFIDPILRFLGNFVLGIVKFVSSSVYDRIFQEMAFGYPDYSHTLVFILFITLLAPLLFALLATFRTNKKPMELEVQQTNEDQIVNEMSTENKKGFNWKLFSLRLGLMFFLLGGITAVVLSEIKLSTIQSFDHHMRILAPYMETKKKDLIISKFARMNGYQDYLEIQQELQEIAKQNSIELPNSKRHLF